MFSYGEGHDWQLIEYAGTTPVYRCSKCGRRSNGPLVFKCGDLPKWVKDAKKPKRKRRVR